LDTFKTLPPHQPVELVLIVGNMADQVEQHMKKFYPKLQTYFIEQKEMRGQSHAIWLARDYLDGPMLMVFSDTLIETDLSRLNNEDVDIIAWVKPVPDPERFGVAQLRSDGSVLRLVEKPKDKSIYLVLVGFYYFKESKALLAAIKNRWKEEYK
jgi:glucose-1-phosphate thymidylyltransferase